MTYCWDLTMDVRSVTYGGTARAVAFITSAPTYLGVWDAAYCPVFFSSGLSCPKATLESLSAKIEHLCEETPADL